MAVKSGIWKYPKRQYATSGEESISFYQTKEDKDYDATNNDEDKNKDNTAGWNKIRALLFPSFGAKNPTNHGVTASLVNASQYNLQQM